MRPRRKRKLTNYGEGHLHWIEESQLQKALIKSLREKSGKNRTNSEDDASDKTPCSSEIPSPSKMPRLSVAVGMIPKKEINANMKCIVNIEDIMDCKKSAKSQDSQKTGNLMKTRILRSQRRGEESHALMMQPRNSDSSSKDSKFVSWSSKTPEAKPESPSKAGTSLPRAQRKFASNASPPNPPRRSARFETRRLVTAGLDKAEPHNEDERSCSNSDDSLPETKDFLDYLCFRRTPLKYKVDFSK